MSHANLGVNLRHWNFFRAWRLHQLYGYPHHTSFLFWNCFNATSHDTHGFIAFFQQSPSRIWIQLFVIHVEHIRVQLLKLVDNQHACPKWWFTIAGRQKQIPQVKSEWIIQFLHPGNLIQSPISDAISMIIYLSANNVICHQAEKMVVLDSFGEISWI